MQAVAEDIDRSRAVTRVLLIEAVCNLFAVLAKLAIGLASGSAALVGDAIHSFTDLANNGLALVAARLAHAPPDREHPYGHGKIESLAVFTLAVLLVVAAIQVAWRGTVSQGPVASQGGWLALLMVVAVAQLAVSTWESRWAKRLDSDLLAADAKHTLSDAVVMAGVLGGWQLAARGHVWADVVAAWAVSGVVLYLAWDLFRRAIPLLIDRAGLDPADLHAVAGKVSGVRSVESARSAGRAGLLRVDVVVRVDPALSVKAGHDVADEVERAIFDRFGAADVSVHVEPAE